MFDPTGNSLSKWGIGKFFSPCGVAISPNGNCIVSDTGDHSVSIYRGEQTCVNRFGSMGSRDNQFDNPLYVTTGVHNEIIVSDSNNHCIKVRLSSLFFFFRVSILSAVILLNYNCMLVTGPNLQCIGMLSNVFNASFSAISFFLAKTHQIHLLHNIDVCRTITIAGLDYYVRHFFSLVKLFCFSL